MKFPVSLKRLFRALSSEVYCIEVAQAKLSISSASIYNDQLGWEHISVVFIPKTHISHLYTSLAARVYVSWRVVKIYDILVLIDQLKEILIIHLHSNCWSKSFRGVRKIFLEGLKIQNSAIMQGYNERGFGK